MRHIHTHTRTAGFFKAFTMLIHSTSPHDQNKTCNISENLCKELFSHGTSINISL